MLTHIISTRLPKLSEEQVTTKIQKTHELLLDVLPSDKQAKGKIETFFVSKLIWYSAFCIDGDVLFLSPYEQERGLRIESPVTEIDLKAYPGVGAWLRDEIERLMGSVVHRKHASQRR